MTLRDSDGPPAGRPRRSTTQRPLVRMLICGTAERGDDAAGLLAAAALLPALDDDRRAVLEVRRCDRLDVGDLVDVPEHARLLIVDAAVGVPPGDVVTVPLDQLAATGGRLPVPRSSRGRSIDHLLALAGALGRRPRGSFVGVGGRRFGFSQGLSRAVRAAMPAFGAAIRAEIDALARAPAG